MKQIQSAQQDKPRVHGVATPPGWMKHFGMPTYSSPLWDYLTREDLEGPGHNWMPDWAILIARKACAVSETRLMYERAKVYKTERWNKHMLQLIRSKSVLLASAVAGDVMECLAVDRDAKSVAQTVAERDYPRKGSEKISAVQRNVLYRWIDFLNASKQKEF